MTPTPDTQNKLPAHAKETETLQRPMADDGSGAAHGGRSIIVATGMGSGKTECFLWPILNHCRRHAGEEGVKAILCRTPVLSGPDLRRAGRNHLDAQPRHRLTELRQVPPVHLPSRLRSRPARTPVRVQRAEQVLGARQREGERTRAHALTHQTAASPSRFFDPVTELTGRGQTRKLAKDSKAMRVRSARPPATPRNGLRRDYR